MVKYGAKKKIKHEKEIIEAFRPHLAVVESVPYTRNQNPLLANYQKHN